MVWMSVVSGLLFGFQGGAQAMVIAGWEVDGVTVSTGAGLDEHSSPYTFQASTLDAHMVSAQLTLGSGVNPSTATNQYGFRISDTQNSLAGAIASGHYLEVALQVAEGYALNLDRLEMRGNTTATGCDDVAWMSSVAGFVPGYELVSLSGRQSAGTGGLDTAASGFGGPIDLGADPYQQLTGTVLFRLYGWNSGSSTGVTRIRNLSGEDLVFYGSVNAIPEPSSLALIGLVSAAWFIRRRRFRHAR